MMWACSYAQQSTSTHCGAQISRGELSEDEMKQRRERSMSDPEIQGILTDPVMTQVLPAPRCLCHQFQTKPAVHLHLPSLGPCGLPANHHPEALLLELPLPFGPKGLTDPGCLQSSEPALPGKRSLPLHPKCGARGRCSRTCRRTPRPRSTTCATRRSWARSRSWSARALCA